MQLAVMEVGKCVWGFFLFGRMLFLIGRRLGFYYGGWRSFVRWILFQFGVFCRFCWNTVCVFVIVKDAFEDQQFRDLLVRFQQFKDGQKRSFFGKRGEGIGRFIFIGVLISNVGGTIGLENDYFVSSYWLLRFFISLGRVLAGNRKFAGFVIFFFL